MCWPHWRRVPRILQRAVWDTFGALQRWDSAAASGAYKGDNRAHGMNEFRERQAQYEKARADAIAAVEAKEAA